MRDFSEAVLEKYAPGRFPFDRMNRVGDMFYAPVKERVMSATVSLMKDQFPNRRFAVFAASPNGSRVFVVDIIPQSCTKRSDAVSNPPSF